MTIRGMASGATGANMGTQAVVGDPGSVGGPRQ